VLEIIEEGTEPSGRDMVQLLRELQARRVAVLPTAAAATDIPLPGIGLEDTVVSCIEVADPGAVAGTPAMVDRTADVTIPSAGNVRVAAATNGTGAGSRLLVTWHDKSGL